MSHADVARLRNKARREARRPWVGHLGRAGLAAQGICFGLIGALAFAAYATWRLAQALLDRGGMGGDAAGLGRRGIQLCQGLMYIGLTFSAVHVLLGARANRGSQRRAAAGVLGWPGGRELVGLAAAILFVIAAVTAYWALSKRFKESLATSEMQPTTERLTTTMGVVGLCSLAIVTGVIGWFLLKAAIEFNARDAVSIGGALSKLAHARYGSYLLGAGAAGLMT